MSNKSTICHMKVVQMEVQNFTQFHHQGRLCDSVFYQYDQIQNFQLRQGRRFWRSAVDEDVAVLLTFETKRFTRIFVGAIHVVIPDLNTLELSNMTGEKEVSHKESSVMNGFVSLFGMFDFFWLVQSRTIAQSSDWLVLIFMRVLSVNALVLYNKADMTRHDIGFGVSFCTHVTMSVHRCRVSVAGSCSYLHIKLDHSKIAQPRSIWYLCCAISLDQFLYSFSQP